MNRKYKIGPLYLVRKTDYDDGNGNGNDTGDAKIALIDEVSAYDVMKRGAAVIRLSLPTDMNVYFRATLVRKHQTIIHGYCRETVDGIRLERHGDDCLVTHTAFEPFSYSTIEHKDDPENDSTDYSGIGDKLYMDNRFPYPRKSYDITEYQSGLFKKISSGLNFFLLETYILKKGKENA